MCAEETTCIKNQKCQMRLEMNKYISISETERNEDETVVCAMENIFLHKFFFHSYQNVLFVEIQCRFLVKLTHLRNEVAYAYLRMKFLVIPSIGEKIKYHLCM